MFMFGQSSSHSVIPFGWNESTYVYRKVSEARTYFLRAKGIPAVTYFVDAWLTRPLSKKKKKKKHTHTHAEHLQWIATFVDEILREEYTDRSAILMAYRFSGFNGVVYV